jgi:hypothetical protein
MTEWNAAQYAKLSGLQAAMAGEVLSLLDLKARRGFWMWDAGVERLRKRLRDA